MAHNTNEHDKKSDLNIQPDRSPFTKLDNKRRNLHSEDVDRGDEISDGDPSIDTKQEEEFQKEPWKKRQ